LPPFVERSGRPAFAAGVASKRALRGGACLVRQEGFGQKPREDSPSRREVNCELTGRGGRGDWGRLALAGVVHGGRSADCEKVYGHANASDKAREIRGGEQRPTRQLSMEDPARLPVRKMLHPSQRVLFSLLLSFPYCFNSHLNSPLLRGSEGLHTAARRKRSQKMTSFVSYRRRNSKLRLVF
jgi:hypothetical protein